jgi:hypothetical protein
MLAYQAQHGQNIDDFLGDGAAHRLNFCDATATELCRLKVTFAERVDFGNLPPSAR